MIGKLAVSVITAALTLTAATAMAAPEKYSCKLLSRPTTNHPFGKVDQIIVDTAENTVEMRESRTADTPMPYNWIFENGGEGFHKATFHVEAQEDGIFGAGVGDRAAYSLALTNDGLLRWVFVESKIVYQIEWQCTK